MEEYMLPCMNKKYLGFECMGCGLQRAFVALIRGEFTEAFLMYPAIYPLIGLLGFIILNHFKSIKYANFIIPTLSIVTVGTIIVSYIIKIT
jgi:hypothetical protein